MFDFDYTPLTTFLRFFGSVSICHIQSTRGPFLTPVSLVALFREMSALPISVWTMKP